MQFIPLLALLIALPAAAQDIPGGDSNMLEIWECFLSSDIKDQKTILTLIRFDDGTGRVHVDRTTISTEFSIAGLDRRWDWEWLDDAQTFRYAIILRMNKRASYFDFGMADADGNALPKEFFVCERLIDRL